MKGRYVGENLRRMKFLPIHTSTKSRVFSWQLTLKKHFIVFVAWSFIKKSLDRFNFGPNIKRWV